MLSQESSQESLGLQLWEDYFRSLDFTKGLVCCGVQVCNAMRLRCGAATAPMLYEAGYWNDDREDEWGEEGCEYSDSDRTVHFARLEKHGEPPSSEEVAVLPRCMQEWWQDRDRIVLLHEYLEVWPPMGHRLWEDTVFERACVLWQVAKERDSLHCMQGDWQRVPAPGYRLLASFPCCPRSLRIPIDKSML